MHESFWKNYLLLDMAKVKTSKREYPVTPSPKVIQHFRKGNQTFW